MSSFWLMVWDRIACRPSQTSLNPLKTHKLGMTVCLPVEQIAADPISTFQELLQNRGYGNFREAVSESYTVNEDGNHVCTLSTALLGDHVAMGHGCKKKDAKRRRY